MNDAVDLLISTMWSVTPIIGLVLAVIRRSSLGRAAAPAIAGFALLLVVLASDLLWKSLSSTRIERPGPVEVVVLLGTSLAYSASLALLVVAVLRRRTPEVPGRTEE